MIPAMGGERKQNPWAEVINGWRVIAAAILSIALSTLPPYSFSVFLDPLAAAFGQGRTAIAGWFLAWSIGGALAAPIFGYLVDRIGPHTVLVSVIPMYSIILYLTSIAPSLSVFHALGFAIGATSTGVGAVGCSRLITQHFDRGLGTALGLMLAGIGASAIFGPAIMQVLVDSQGWQAGYRVMAGAGLALALIVWFLTKADAGLSDPVASHTSAKKSKTLPAIVGAQAFWILLVAVFSFGICVGGITINMMPTLGEAGLSRSRAALSMSLFGGFTVVGRLLMGMMFDRTRLHVGHSMAVSQVALGLGCLLLAGGAGYSTSAMIVLGLAVGAMASCLPYCVAKLFPSDVFGAAYALIGVTGMYLGSGVGPVAFSGAVASLGLYSQTLIYWAAGCVANAVIFLAIVRFPYAQPKQMAD